MRGNVVLSSGTAPLERESAPPSRSVVGCVAGHTAGRCFDPSRNLWGADGAQAVGHRPGDRGQLYGE